MTYQKFKSTYHWTVKKYPGTDSLYRPDMCEEIGTAETVNYEKRGRKWIETGRNVETLTRAFYFNTVDAVPFFRNLGGHERVEMAYTRAGYIPVEIHSTRPDGMKKTVRKFYID